MSVDIETIGLNFDVSGLQRGDRALENTTRNANQASSAADRAATSFAAIGSAMGMLKGLIAAAGIGMLAAQFVETASAVSLMDARLKLAMGNLDDFKQAQKDVYEIAQKNRIGLAETAALYTKLADPIREAGGGVKEIKGIVEAFTTTLRVSGASTEDAASATLQFAQAMASGKLQGDEFKSMAETSPRFMKALAEGLNLPVGKLKEMASEGNLTADVVGNALVSSLTKLRQEAATLPDTAGGAFNMFKNDLMNAVRELNDNPSVTGGLVDLIQQARAMIPDVRDELVGAFQAVNGWLQRNNGELAEIWDIVKDVAGDFWELGKDIASIVGFTSEWGVGTGVIQTTLIAVRFLIAGLQDGTKILGASFAHVGSSIMQLMVFPMQTMLRTSAKLAGLFNTELAGKINGIVAQVDDFTQAGEKYAARVVEDFGNGETAVAKLQRTIGETTTATDKGKSAAESAAEAYKKLRGAAGAGGDGKGAAAAAREMDKQSKALLQLAGLTTSFTEDWNRLSAMYGKGKISLEQLTAAQAELLNKQPAIKAAADAEIKAKQDIIDFNKRYGDGLRATTSLLDEMEESQRKETEVMEEAAKNFGLTKTAIEQNTLARMQNQLAMKDQTGMGMIEEEHLKRMIALQERKVAAAAVTDGGTSLTQAKEMLEVMTAVDQAAQQAANGMASAFGRVGSAIGGLTTAMTGFSVQQASIAAELAANMAKAAGDPAKIAAANKAAAQSSAQAQVKSYGDMAGAAKGFFKENSSGYKAMEAAEKTFRAVEMAMAMQSMVKKIFFKEGEVAANLALNSTKLAGEASTTAASTGLAATEASAWGVTAVVKAIASLPFPFNLAAGAATLAAVVAVGAKVMGSVGSGNVSVSEQRQKTQGTGSVFGDPNAKSESIANSLALLQSNSGVELNYTRGMLTALRNIESSMGGMANVIIRGNIGIGSEGGEKFSSMSEMASKLLGGGKLGEFAAKVTNSIFGGKVSTVDTGITAGRTSLGTVMQSGVQASQYTETKKDGGFFRSDKYRTSTAALGSEANSQISAAVVNMANAVKQAGSLLGVAGNNLNSFVVDIGKISLKGLSGDQIQKQLEAVFSKVGDDMARYAISGLAPFQKVGEGYLETLIRVASNYANLDSALQSAGLTFGATGMASIAARESLIELVGGMSELQSKTSSFAENYLTEAERLAPVQKYVAEQMRAMNLAHIDTRQEFADHVKSLNLVNAAEREQFAALMDLESAFAKVHAANVDLTKSEQAIADERRDLQKQVDEMVLTTEEQISAQRKSLDASNRGLFDQLQAIKAAVAAQDKAKDSLKALIGQMQSFGDQATKTADSLLVGTLSTKTPEEQYEELRRQYETTKAKAKSGDVSAQNNYSSSLTAFLTASQKINGGDAKYQQDFAMGQADAVEMGQWALGQVDVAKAQLTALEKQNIALETLNATAHMIAQNTQPAMGAVGLNASLGLGTMPGMNYSGGEGLAAEIKNLRVANAAKDAEIAALRADQNRQTGDIITANAKAQERAAETIVAGVAKAVSTNRRSSNWKITEMDLD